MNKDKPLPQPHLPIKRWHERRREANAMLALAVRDDDFEGQDLDRLACLVQQITGTATIFSEPALDRLHDELDLALEPEASAGDRLDSIKTILRPI